MTSIKRNTWQRAAVRDFFEANAGFSTAQQVYTGMHDLGAKVGLATVYRALQSMVESGELDVVRTFDGDVAYRACTPGHHHHIVCRNCTRTVEIEAEPVEDWARSIAEKYGYTDAGHEIELFGICSVCAKTQ